MKKITVRKPTSIKLTPLTTTTSVYGPPHWPIC